MTKSSEMPKAYEAREAEARWYESWERAGYFEASRAAEDDRPTYTIAIPPPNVTGSLHMGHACRTTFEDVLIRHKRMQGRDTLWIPGTDHAGIATQVVVERKLRAEGLSRHDIGREKFVERVWEWKAESGGTILGQLRKMGASCDWSRERFTMDEGLSRAVREAFVRLHEEGLIYRATRLINWCCSCRTALSGLEVDSQEGAEGELFDFAYPLAEGEGELIVSTTRPETMLGDTAVAVHPEDPRYTHLHGKQLRHPFVDRLVPIITDAELVDPEFGTGAVKVTPAHDPNDFETGRRHGLEEIAILHQDGTLNEQGGPFAGMERFAARKAVKAALEERGLARGARKHILTLPRCQRCAEIVEPMISTQWFVKMEPLAGPAIAAVERGDVQILPEEWTKTYFHWLRNIQDWCVSRQLWWGHPIPAWYCPQGHVTVARETPSACGECGEATLLPDEDVLDTWFSSALWPFSTLGWPEQTPDLKRFYPTQDMETGYDILFFWVARMIMMGLHFMGEVPFSRVLLAGLVTDERGEKMSKVKGNVVDPLDVIGGASLEQLIAKAEKAGARKSGIKYLEKTYPEGFIAYGADALRMTLLSYSPQAKRIALSIKRVEGYRNFANKLWNAARYALMRLEGSDALATGHRPEAQALPNRWILSRLDAALIAADAGLEEYRLDDASGALYRFVWDELCDWYLELSKPLLESEDPALVRETESTLVHVLESTLRALHPMMPFVTEEIWQRVPKEGFAESIMICPYPMAAREGLSDELAETQMGALQDLIIGLRTIRAEHDLPRAQKIEVHWHSEEPARAAVFEAQALLIGALAGCSLRRVDDPAIFDAEPPAFERAAFFARHGVRAAVPGAIDVERERDRLERELQKLDKDLSVVRKKLRN
ncbi:MAG: valine--tRNA ligase, partial [Myxococcales bacterium]|nr:valine--tRNA ligase [Myxococcales bacterium]